MPELKPISKEAIPQALAKTTRYRLLNEPAQAESICRDVLTADPANQEANYALILALTDRFGHKGATSLGDTLKLTEQPTDPYHRDYARGIIYERQAGAALEGSSMHAGDPWRIPARARDHGIVVGVQKLPILIDTDALKPRKASSGVPGRSMSVV